MNFTLITHKVTITVNLMDSLLTHNLEDLVFLQEKKWYLLHELEIFVAYSLEKKRFS